jgi:hypothetical protein
MILVSMTTLTFSAFSNAAAQTAVSSIVSATTVFGTNCGLICAGFCVLNSQYVGTSSDTLSHLQSKMDLCRKFTAANVKRPQQQPQPRMSPISCVPTARNYRPLGSAPPFL